LQISLKDMFASEMKEPAKVVVKSNILDKKVPATPSRKSTADVASSQPKVASTPVSRPASEAAPAAAEPAVDLPPVSHRILHLKEYRIM
jgi:hypothetical protein